MADDPLSKVALVARERIFKNRNIIKQTIANVAAGNPLASEKDPVRLVDRLMAKNLMTREEAEATAIGIRAFASMPAAERADVRCGVRRSILPAYRFSNAAGRQQMPWPAWRGIRTGREGQASWSPTGCLSPIIMSFRTK